MEKKCICCGDKPARFKISVTDMDGNLIDLDEFCEDCIYGVAIVASKVSGEPLIC